VSPTRHWEALPPSRIRGAGSVAGERTCGTLSDEILAPGAEQLRALFCFGGNPAAAVPDRNKITTALSALELLVIVDPFMTDSALLADYVLPPTIFYERSDMLFPCWLETLLIPAPFQQCLPPVADPPPDSDVMEDWRIMWELSKRLGVQVTLDGVELDMQAPPSSEDLLAILARNGQVPFEEIRSAPEGAFFDVEQTVEQADPATAGRFHVLPPDMATQLRTMAAEPMSPQHHWRDDRAFSHSLASRRLREVYNSFGPQLRGLHRRRPYNPAYLHPDDLTDLHLAPGDRAWIESAHGTISAIVDSDPALKRGVVSMAHGWGRNPGEASDDAVDGSSTSLLIADDHACDTIHVQPRMSGIPVNVHATAPADVGVAPD
jgi:anaerobic selenocysteine-containing dehydrogenase